MEPGILLESLPFTHEPMPCDYLRDDAARRVRLTLTHPVTVKEMIEVVDRQLAEGAWSYGTIADARRLSTPPPLENLREFVAHIRQLVETHGQRGPLVIVANAPGAVAGGHIYAVLGAKADSAVDTLWDMDEAERWLSERMAR